MRAAQDVSIPSGNAIPAPQYWQPASKAPSPMVHMVIGCGIGLVFAGYYKVRCAAWMVIIVLYMRGITRPFGEVLNTMLLQMAYWSWKKEVNQFYHDYNKVMAEEGPGAQ